MPITSIDASWLPPGWVQYPDGTYGPSALSQSLSPYAYQGDVLRPAPSMRPNTAGLLDPPTIEGMPTRPMGDLLGRILPGGLAGMAARQILQPTPAETGPLPTQLFPRNLGGAGMAGSGGPGRSPAGPWATGVPAITAGLAPMANPPPSYPNPPAAAAVPPSQSAGMPWPSPQSTPGPLATSPADIPLPPVRPVAAKAKKPPAASVAAPSATAPSDLPYYYSPTTGIGRGQGTRLQYKDPNDPRIYKGR